MGFGKELLLLGSLCMLGPSFSSCPLGYLPEGSECLDENECDYLSDLCEIYSQCFNTIGSYYCQCLPGFTNIRGLDNFTAYRGPCVDINECLSSASICGPVGTCMNLIGRYECICPFGYTNNNRSQHQYCTDINECEEAEVAGEDLCDAGGTCRNTNGSYWCKCMEGYSNYGNERTRCSDINECEEAEVAGEDLCDARGTCRNTNGSYWCKCMEGYSNYGNERTRCSELNCSNFNRSDSLSPPVRVGLESVVSVMRNNCLTLSEGITAEKDDGELLLETLIAGIERVVSQGPLENQDQVSETLFIVERSIRLLSPQLKQKRTRIERGEMEAEIAVEKGGTVPSGPIRLTTESACLDADWTTAARTPAYPGFGLAALLSYNRLVITLSQCFEKPMKHGKDGVGPIYRLLSSAVSFVVHNSTSQNLGLSINITFSYFAPIYWLVEVAKKGLAMSLLCLIVCILTFKFGRAIQGTRTTIHLHLCICLFMGGLFFLAGISESGTAESCRFVAAMLHFFILGAFTWMLLEAIQLYRMVVLVFTATIRPIFLFPAGYGVPLVIVIITALLRPKAAGPDQYCQLSVKFGLFWSFLTTACFTLTLSVFIFMVTAWKLAGKFTSLHSDPDKELKVKCVAVTAATQACVLGLMRMFWILILQEDTELIAYVFAALNSLQGMMLFVVHCLLSEKVRKEYACFFSRLCTPKKKRKRSYDFRGSNSPINHSQSDQHIEELQL